MDIKLRQCAGHLRAAIGYGQTSYAKRYKVGCIIVKPEPERQRTLSLSHGYNGTPPGDDNTCEYEQDGLLITKPNVIHAEMNALSKLSPDEAKDAWVFCTLSPCGDCAQSLISSNIKAYVFHEFYRNREPLKKLRDAGIFTLCISDLNKELSSTTGIIYNEENFCHEVEWDI